MKLHPECLRRFCRERYTITLLQSREELNAQTVVRVTGREKCNQNFIAKTLEEETTSSVGGRGGPRHV